MKELNKELAGWRWPAGKCLAFVPSTGDILWGTEEEQHWVNFPQSLDACFKWLKPAVISKGTVTSSILTWRTVLHNWLKAMAVEKAMDDKPALALCLAIEKLIDNKLANPIDNGLNKV